MVHPSDRDTFDLRLETFQYVKVILAGPLHLSQVLDQVHRFAFTSKSQAFRQLQSLSNKSTCKVFNTYF